VGRAGVRLAEREGFSRSTGHGSAGGPGTGQTVTVSVPAPAGANMIKLGSPFVGGSAGAPGSSTATSAMRVKVTPTPSIDAAPWVGM
jgi:hypothetical protein